MLKDLLKQFETGIFKHHTVFQFFTIMYVFWMSFILWLASKEDVVIGSYFWENILMFGLPVLSTYFSVEGTFDRFKEKVLKIGTKLKPKRRT